jgi:hypothetical protein
MSEQYGWTWNGKRIHPISLPVDPPDATADEVIRIIQQPRATPSSLSEHYAATVIVNDVMVFVTHWFYKIRFNKKYKIPFSRSVTKDFYDLAVMFVALYNLCVEWHSYPECYD